MRLALALAAEAAEEGEVPVGAVVVQGDRVVGTGRNRREREKNALAHAELEAIREACSRLGDWRLEGCALFVTLEPCAMCAGAMVNARLGKLVFACPDPRMGAAGSALDITGFSGMLHQVEVQSGLLEDEAREILQSFFRQRRQDKNA